MQQRDRSSDRWTDTGQQQRLPLSIALSGKDDIPFTIHVDDVFKFDKGDHGDGIDAENSSAKCALPWSPGA